MTCAFPHIGADAAGQYALGRLFLQLSLQAETATGERANKDGRMTRRLWGLAQVQKGLEAKVYTRGWTVPVHQRRPASPPRSDRGDSRTKSHYALAG